SLHTTHHTRQLSVLLTLVRTPSPVLPPVRRPPSSPLFFFNDTAPTEIYTLSLHDALPISAPSRRLHDARPGSGELAATVPYAGRSEEHTSELQSLTNLVCRLLLEKKKKKRPTLCTPTLLRTRHDVSWTAEY